MAALESALPQCGLTGGLLLGGQFIFGVGNDTLVFVFAV